MAEYSKSTEQLYKESLSDSSPAKDSKGRKFSVEGNDLTGYIGTDPVYQTYANDTEKPLTAKTGPDVAIIKEYNQLQDALTGKVTKEEDEPEKKVNSVKSPLKLKS